jgi:hypothetical protein
MRAGQWRSRINEYLSALNMLDEAGATQLMFEE